MHDKQQHMWVCSLWTDTGGADLPITDESALHGHDGSAADDSARNNCCILTGPSCDWVMQVSGHMFAAPRASF